jgi:hypothetical protein
LLTKVEVVDLKAKKYAGVVVNCRIDVEGDKGDIDKEGREAQDLREEGEPHLFVRVRVVVQEGVVQSENTLNM